MFTSPFPNFLFICLFSPQVLVKKKKIHRFRLLAVLALEQRRHEMPLERPSVKLLFLLQCPAWEVRTWTLAQAKPMENLGPLLVQGRGGVWLVTQLQELGGSEASWGVLSTLRQFGRLCSDWGSCWAWFRLWSG